VTPPDPSPVLALGREVERLTRRSAAHDVRIEDLAALLQQLATDLTTLAPTTTTTPEPPVRSWLLGQDPAQARADLADLLDWLAQVYLRYPDAALVSCWLWHPAVIEELCWLRRAHHDAYHGPHASSTRAGDWHDRHRPSVTQRLRAWLRDCDLSRHQPGPPARAVPLAGSADRIAAAWTQHRQPPPPTTEEITEADQHDRHEHRTHHR
jgi:hypothetical protein